MIRRIIIVLSAFIITVAIILYPVYTSDFGTAEDIEETTESFDASPQCEFSGVPKEVVLDCTDEYILGYSDDKVYWISHEDIESTRVYSESGDLFMKFNDTYNIIKITKNDDGYMMGYNYEGSRWIKFVDDKFNETDCVSIGDADERIEICGLNNGEYCILNSEKDFISKYDRDGNIICSRDLNSYDYLYKLFVSNTGKIYFCSGRSVYELSEDLSEIKQIPLDDRETILGADKDGNLVTALSDEYSMVRSVKFLNPETDEILETKMLTGSKFYCVTDIREFDGENMRILFANQYDDEFDCRAGYVIYDIMTGEITKNEKFDYAFRNIYFDSVFYYVDSSNEHIAKLCSYSLKTGETDEYTENLSCSGKSTGGISHSGIIGYVERDKIVLMDTSGKESAEYTIDDYLKIIDMSISDNKKILMKDEEEQIPYVFYPDRGGNAKKAILKESFENITDIVWNSDFDIFAVIEESDGKYFYSVNNTRRKIGEKISEVPGGVKKFINGSGKYDFFYCRSDGIYGMDFASGQSTKIIDYKKSQIKLCDNIKSIEYTDDGSLCIISGNCLYIFDD